MDEPIIFTLPKGADALPDEMGQLKVGGKIMVMGTITAIDDNGLSFEPQSAEGAPEEETPKEDATEPAEEPVATENKQADYVSGRRKQMMSGTE